MCSELLSLSYFETESEEEEEDSVSEEDSMENSSEDSMENLSESSQKVVHRVLGVLGVLGVPVLLLLFVYGGLVVVLRLLLVTRAHNNI
jgi:hypothetical protein